MFLHRSFSPPVWDTISSHLGPLLGEDYHRPVGWAGVEIIAAIKLGTSSLYILVILWSGGKRLLAAESLCRILFAATSVISGAL